MIGHFDGVRTVNDKAACGGVQCMGAIITPQLAGYLITIAVVERRIHLIQLRLW